TIDTIIEHQLAMDEALVPTTQRLNIGRRNFRLLSDIKSKELTLQLVYDVLRRCPFFKAFLVTADVLKIYMQEFWATVTVHHLAIRFKMDNEKHIINMESFRDILHIFLRVHGQSFNEPPFKEEILAFIRFLRHIVPIKTLTDLTNDEIKNSKAYKEYYAIATGEAAPKPKASVRRAKSSFDTSITPPTAAASQRLTASLKLVTMRSRKQMHISQPSGSGADEGTGSIPGVPDVLTDESEKELSWKSTDDKGDEEDEGDDDKEVKGDDNVEDDDGEEGDYNTPYFRVIDVVNKFTMYLLYCTRSL
nr:hypothetical protein [Tanacetum cinerariifolium]